jgi:hypothetical protein
VPDTSGSVDLGSLSQEEQEALEALAEKNPPEPEKPQVLTAFLVVVGTDGNPQVMAFPDPDLEMLSEPTNDLVFQAASTIVKDIQLGEAAQATVAMMAQQAQMMAQHQQEAMIRARLAGEGAFRG